MADTPRPPYVHRWQLSGSPQPFQAYGAFMWGFVFPADLAILEGLVHRLLNHDPSGRVAYAPYVPFVLFGFSALDYVRPKAAPFRELGGGYEYELAVWVPVRRRGSLAPMLFAPYIFVNNPVAVVQGREIYGFAKEMAWLRKTRWPSQFPVDAFVIERRDGEAVRHWTRVLSVDRVRRRARRTREWRTFAEAATELRALVIGTTPLARLAALSPLAGGLWPPNAPLVLRKRFPDCADPARACYLGIVEAHIRVDQVDYGSILTDPYVLRLPDRTLHPLARDLGLRNGLGALMAYEMKFSFELEAGREVWCAMPDGTEGTPASPLSHLVDLATALPRHVVDLGVNAVQSAVGAWVDLTSASEPAPEPLPPRRAKKRKKEKIVILGGGVGAMVAAFALTEVPDWRERYDITVYQLGWRLGGKGASGRNRTRHERIEEHGIHVWFGFYENAFRIMRRCYQELDQPHADAASTDPILWGFEPHDLLVLQRQMPDGSWKPNPVRMPPTPGWPGAEGSGDAVPSAPHEYITAVLRWMLSALFDAELPAGLAEADGHGALAEAEWAPVRERLGVEAPGAHPANLLSAAVALTASTMGWGDFGGGDYGILNRMLDRVMQWLRDALHHLAAADDVAHRLWVLMDLGATVVRGMLQDGAVFGGFDILNDEDFADWLTRHGADPVHTVRAEWVRALYSQAFAFEDGDTDKPRAAAGTVLRALGRMVLTYRHAFVFKMKSGMGDTIFAPLFQVLEKRGVTFNFFHRVDRLELSPDGGSIGRIHVGCQAHPKGGRYQPLVNVKGWWCWPNGPDYTQLEEADEIAELMNTPGAYVNFESAWSSWGPQYEDARTLTAGVDFDRVILGIPVGSLSHICADLVAASSRWRQMVQRVKTVRTQAFQLWLNRSLAETGWTLPPPIVTAFVEPLDTWADMTHTLPTEDWPAPEPRHIAYFCGVMKDSAREPQWYSDPTFAPSMKQRAFAEMRRFLQRDIGSLWPAITGPQGLDWNTLVDTTGGQGIQRLDGQYWIANIDPSERYVLSLPGTIAARLRSDQSGFRNLYLAGDWTYTGINAGCVEAATMSGLRAARAICGWPERIIGEEHLD